MPSLINSCTWHDFFDHVIVYLIIKLSRPLSKETLNRGLAENQVGSSNPNICSLSPLWLQSAHGIFTQLASHSSHQTAWAQQTGKTEKMSSSQHSTFSLCSPSIGKREEFFSRMEHRWGSTGDLAGKLSLFTAKHCFLLDRFFLRKRLACSIRKCSLAVWLQDREEGGFM